MSGSNELVDAEARRAIREDLDATLVVEAAAGTGKTTEMIQRVIAVLRTGASTLERIVAVTFTEKAAGEMKLRLRTELERARQEATGIGRDRLEAALGELEVARIGSIHSFCADLLRERPIEAHVDPLFEVAAEEFSEQLFSRAFDAWFAGALADPTEGVRRILRRDKPTELLRRAGWSLVDRRDFDGAWRRDPFSRDAEIDAVLAELRPLAALADRAHRADDNLAKLCTKLDRWLAELDRREAVRPRDHDGLEAEVAQVLRWREWKPTGRGDNFGEGLLRADVIVQRDAAKARLASFRDAADADLAACLREELRPLVAGYEQLKAKSGRLDFLDLLVRTRDLLERDVRVRAELAARFTHFFVDEFQDTDPLQVEILMLLCGPNGDDVAPGKLFVVGDPKQAIYRFRRADIAVYEQVVQRLRAGGARLLHLTTSFRAVESIQAAINAAFEPIMQGGHQARYVALERHRGHLDQPSIIALPVPKPYGWRDVANIAIEESYPDAVGAFVEHLQRSDWRVGGGAKIERSGSAGPRSAPEGERGGRIERSGSAGPRSAPEGERGGRIERSGSAGPRSAPEGERGGRIERSGSAGPRSAPEGERGGRIERSGSAGPRSAPEGERGGRIEPRHVCLMFRRFQSFGKDLTRPYVRALEARGIPHVLVGGRSFHEREEILTSRNALRAIEWPDDELAVYATLRGPLFAFADEDLFAFKHEHGRLSPLAWRKRDSSERLARSTVTAALADQMIEIAGALRTLAELHVRRNRRPIADSLARLFAETRAHAGIAVWPAGEQALANVSRVLDLARRFESGGASSFRAFVDRLEDDAEHGRQADAPVVEEGTDGVRIMTVHAAKGLEFPVVILCDPTAPLAQERPSRVIDTARKVWLEPLAGCVPSELAERADEVIERDREEGQRLAYVAVTRARDLLVVPVVGDEERDGWLEALAPVVHPDAKTKRAPVPAPKCPAFGDDSLVARGKNSQQMPYDSVAPGLHVPRAGTHRVVWWDPNKLALERELGGGVRHQQILAADDDNTVAPASEAAHLQWRMRRAAALTTGGLASLDVRKVTDEAKRLTAIDGTVTIEATAIARDHRPHGARFGSLVHAVLATVDLRAPRVRAIAENHARLVGASPEELAAAIAAVDGALAHPMMQRAAAARELRREVPVALATSIGGMIEGVVDLAFVEHDAWIVVDYKTDAELGDSRAIYEAQVRLYARAIAAATGKPALPSLFLV